MTDDLVPGEVRPGDGNVTLNEDRETTTLAVANTGDRPIQIGSHVHFFEVNRALAFDREIAFGKRLNVPAGTAVRFEPGDETDVELVALGGEGRAYGLNGLTDGDNAGTALERARENGFVGAEDEEGAEGGAS
ncbi:urease subunit beta [Halococcus sp. PRR34]|uniref:urease subunit beta n=1 Tax=Halococcus sp. PRR34 TaxID=3020830 RepID=UPI0023627B79|nr:urease subunit beta [Halococcus sp. PRR34]